MTHPNADEQRFVVIGMDCADCAQHLERSIQVLDGVTSCAVNFATAQLRVIGDAPPEAIQARARALGYELRSLAAPLPALPTTASVMDFTRFLAQRGETQRALIGAGLVVSALCVEHLLPLAGAATPNALAHALSIAALVVAGAPIAAQAMRALLHSGQITINLLMTLAAIGATVIGAYSEAGVVIVLFAIAEALEGYTTERARNAIHGLMALTPNEAIRLSAHGEQRVPVEALQVGERVIVKPGERIPVDGVVRNGCSHVNQAPITGESMPVEKRAGDAVYAGSLNGTGALEVEVTRRVEESVLHRVVQLVAEATERKAPTQRFIDQFARYYTPAVVGLAIAIAALPPLLFGEPFWPSGTAQGWLYRALELLVAACPCALVISTPVALVSALGSAAKHGVLIKGGAHLEALSRVKVIAFDKTGTLTLGQPSVVAARSTRCETADPCPNCDELVALACAVERRSEHPIAQAVLTEAARRSVSERYPSAETVQALVGRGLVGMVNGRQVCLGSHAFFDATLPHDARWCEEIEAAAREGHTPVLVSVDGEYQGYLAVADTPRHSARAVVQQLRAEGVQRVVMLTGDTSAAARHIAHQVGIAEVHAELLPEQKLRMVEALAAQHGSVAMVGDGINDAPALAAATVGIAISDGTNQAMQTADVVLLNNDLSRLPYALRLSRRTMRIIRANIALALGIKLGFVALALLGLGTMWLAVLADMGASLLVTVNGLRLLRSDG
ncbi:MAG: heavy metal translocating P-type ATPase [Thermoflexales bacterium]